MDWVIAERVVKKIASEFPAAKTKMGVSRAKWHVWVTAGGHLEGGGNKHD